jgi:hypothetical protein
MLSKKDRFYMLLFYFVDQFSDLPIGRLSFGADAFNSVRSFVAN